MLNSIKDFFNSPVTSLRPTPVANAVGAALSSPSAPETEIAITPASGSIGGLLGDIGTDVLGVVVKNVDKKLSEDPNGKYAQGKDKLIKDSVWTWIRENIKSIGIGFGLLVLLVFGYNKLKK